jgi:uncharacterized damage-inducible protein DinB
MSFSEMLLPEFDEEMRNTRKMLEAVPTEKFGWKPHDRSMTLGRLASHVGEMPGWVTVTIGQDKLELTPGQKPYLAESQEQLLADFDKQVSTAREAIAGATDERLAQPWSLVYGGHTMFSNPRSVVLRTMVMSHMIHHRGQLSVYLRLLDVAIPGMYGPSADSRPPSA